MSFVCSTCNDTHRMTLEGLGDVMCTHCPIPCGNCRARTVTAYCQTTPCACSCHAARAAIEPPCGGRSFPSIATALRAKNAELVHVLKQLREVIQPSVPAIIGSYIVMTPDVDVEWAHGVRNRVEKVGREIDDALIAFADDLAVKERAELQRQLAEARAAAQFQADVIADQDADLRLARARLVTEQLKTADMTKALGEVWEQVPDEDRIGKQAPDWVRGLGRRVRELTAAPAEHVVPAALLRVGGSWLGAARQWILWNRRNGSQVTWGSSDVLDPPFTAADAEDLAAHVAADVMNGRVRR